MARTQRRRIGAFNPAAASAAASQPRRSAATLNGSGTLRRQVAPPPNPFAFLPAFSRALCLSWPTRKVLADDGQTRFTIVVAFVAVTVGLLLGGIDLLFGWIIERMFF
jgi:hypothetical protein